MPDMRNMSVEEQVAYVIKKLREATTHNLGDIPSKKEAEKALSDATGCGIRLRDYDPQTGSATQVDVAPPYTAGNATITIETTK